MSKDLELENLSERFDHLVNLIQSKRFLKKEGLNNEIPFFLCPFKNEAEYKEIDSFQVRLKNKLEKSGVTTLILNLYDLVIEILKKRNRFDQLIAREHSFSKDKLLEFLRNVANTENHLVPLISEKIQSSDSDVIFLGGFGEVFPYIKSNIILNNLQSKTNNKPIIIFFPGEYVQNTQGGSSLNLFNKNFGDKYYRAFNIYQRGI